MKIIGCDLHAAQQTIAMLDRETGEIVEQTLKHEAGTVREFYAALPAPVVVGLEATGSMGWFLQLFDELGITYGRRSWGLSLFQLKSQTNHRCRGFGSKYDVQA